MFVPTQSPDEGVADATPGVGGELQGAAGMNDIAPVKALGEFGGVGKAPPHVSLVT